MKNEKWNITVGELEAMLGRLGEHAEVWVEIDSKISPIRDYYKAEDGKLILKIK